MSFEKKDLRYISQQTDNTSLDTYKSKYLKYKQKYKLLKAQLGGTNFDCKKDLSRTTKLKDICHKDNMGQFNNYEECATSDKCLDKWREDLRIFIERIYNLYVKFRDIHATNVYFRNSIDDELRKIEQDKTILKNLNVDFTMKEIEANFEKYGIIILRKPKKYSLLVGCGNGSISNDLTDATLKYHLHKDHDTISLDLTLNPMIVGGFGVDDGIYRYFEDIGKKYSFFVTESVTLFSADDVDLEEKINKICSILKEVYECMDITYNINTDIEEIHSRINNIKEFKNTPPVYRSY